MSRRVAVRTFNRFMGDPAIKSQHEGYGVLAQFVETIGQDSFIALLPGRGTEVVVMFWDQGAAPHEQQRDENAPNSPAPGGTTNGWDVAMNKLGMSPREQEANSFR